MTPPSNQIDNWKVAARPGGWLRLQRADGKGAAIYLRYQLSGPQGKERLTLQTVVMQGDDDEGEGLSGRVWRSVPLSQVEQALAPLTATDLPAPQAQAVQEMRAAFHPSEQKPLTVDELDEYFKEGSPVDDLVDRIRTEVADPGDPVLTPPDATELRPPEGRLSDDFLRTVASAYRYYAPKTKSPAKAIADRANVPVRTVHRWVLKAREKEFLPPARRGRAG